MNKTDETVFQNTLAELRKLREENERLKAEISDTKKTNVDLGAMLSVAQKSLEDRDSKIRKKDAKITSMKAEMVLKDKTIAELSEKIEMVKKQLSDMKLMKQEAMNALFGKSSAKTKNVAKKIIDATPEKAGGEPDSGSTAASAPDATKYTPKAEKRGRKKGTKDFDGWKAGNYIKEEESFEIKDGKAVCSDCGSNMVFDHFEKYTKISVVPEHLRKTEILTAVYRCRNCGKTIRAAVPKEKTDCFGKSACTPSLAGFLCMLSCGLFLPNQRISTLFGYAGTPVSKELVTRYLIRSAEILKPLCEILRQHALDAHVLHMDETHWDTLAKEDEGTNYIWSMTTGLKEKEQVSYYMYSPNRKYENLSKMAEGYKGVIVSDSYGAYFRENLHQLCLSHLRKYLYDYVMAAAGSDNADAEDVRQVSELLGKCNAIFEKERDIGKDEDSDITKRRREELKPLLDDYFATAQKYFDKDVSDSKNRAINYGLKNKELYYTMVEDPAVPATNNRAEQTMRKAVQKRTSSLFSSSRTGAQATCTIMTVVQTARLNGLLPDRYVAYLLENYGELGDGRTARKYLPWSESIPDDIRVPKKA